MFVQLKHPSASEVVKGGKLVQWTKRMDESERWSTGDGLKETKNKRQEKSNADR